MPPAPGIQEYQPMYPPPPAYDAPGYGAPVMGDPNIQYPNPYGGNDSAAGRGTVDDLQARFDSLKGNK